MSNILAEPLVPDTHQNFLPVFTVITNQEGNIRSANDAFLRAIARPFHEISGRPFHDYFEPSATALSPSGLQHFFEQHPAVFHCVAALKEAGGYLSCRWAITPLQVASGTEPLWQWLGEPMKNVLQSSASLPPAEAVYRSLFDESPQPMWVYDKNNLRFLDVNRAALELYGYSRQAFLGKTMLDLRPQADGGKPANATGAEQSNKAVWTHQKSDGSIVLAEIQSHDFAFSGHEARLVIVNDITEREKIRKILEESEARFRHMADNAPVMIWISNEEDLTVYVNKYWTDFTGISRDEAWGDGWNKVIHPDDIHIGIGEYKKGLQEKKPVSLIYRLRYRTGEYRWVLDKSIPRFLEDGTFLGYIGSLVDIHDYKLAEEKISFQAKLIESASDIIISIDLNFNVVAWNHQAELVYEIRAEDAIGKPVLSLLKHAFLKGDRDTAYEELMKNGSWQGEASYTKTNGEQLFLHSNVTALRDGKNNITGYIAVNRDITARVTAEQTMLLSKKKFKSILQNFADVVFILDEEGLIQYVTPSVRQLLGYSEEALVALSLFSFVHADDKKRLQLFFRELLADPGGTFSADIRLRNHEGAWCWLEAKGVNKFADTAINGILLSVHDISERKRSEQQLQAYSGHITSILNSITDGFIALDTNYCILWWNPIAEQLTGVKDVEVLGKNLWDSFPDLRKIKNLSKYEKAIAQKKAFSLELYVPALKVYFEINAYPSQQGLFIYFKDITRRKAQQTLLSLEKKVLELHLNPENSLRKTIDYFLVGMEKLFPGVLCSVLTLDDDGKTMQHLSAPSLPPGWTKMVNGLAIGPQVGSCGTAIYTRQTVIVEDVQTDFRWIQFREQAAHYNLQACWSFPIITSFNQVLGSFAGYYRQKMKPTEDQLELFKRVATLIGVIAENKRAQQQLNISNERYTLATKATNDAIWDYDIKTRRLYWSEGFNSIFGYTAGHYAGEEQTWETKLHPDDGQRIQKMYNQALKNKDRGILYSEYLFRKADGKYALVADRAFIVWSNDGKPLRFVGAMQDITDRRKTEELLMAQEINKQKTIAQAVVDAQEKERAEIGKELHDNVNQILSTAKLYLELAKTDTTQRDTLITRSADSIFTAINEIRLITRALVPPSVKDLGLIDSINDLVESLRLTTKLQVKFTHKGDFDEVIKDKQKLMLFRIIQEQVSNVLKHAAARRVGIDLKLAGKLISLSISDDGQGFEPEKIKFKKGVGLTNIESRVQLFNGQVTITTAPGKGCKLFIQVPIHNN
jgi:PAS domain S-box-containing protein